MSELIISKTCCCCKKPKGLDEFYRRKSGRLGRDHRCKACHAIYAKSERRKESERKAHQLYFRSDKGKERHRAARLLYSHTDKGKKAIKRRREKCPGKIKARMAVGNEMQSGRLPSAKTHQCKHCGKQATMYHHWLGYAREHWLDVIPLCQTCDTLAHAHSSEVLMV